HLGKGFKNRLDLAFRICMQDSDLQAERMCRHLYVFRLRGGSCEIRVDKRGNGSRLGSQIMQRLQLFRSQGVNEKGHARYVSTWPAEAGHKSNFDRIDAIRKHNRTF